MMYTTVVTVPTKIAQEGISENLYDVCNYGSLCSLELANDYSWSQLALQLLNEKDENPYTS